MCWLRCGFGFLPFTSEYLIYFLFYSLTFVSWTQQVLQVRLGAICGRCNLNFFVQLYSVPVCALHVAILVRVCCTRGWLKQASKMLLSPPALKGVPIHVTHMKMNCLNSQKRHGIIYKIHKAVGQWPSRVTLHKERALQGHSHTWQQYLARRCSQRISS